MRSRKQQLPVADLRQAWREAAGGAALVLGPHRGFVALSRNPMRVPAAGYLGDTYCLWRRSHDVTKLLF